MATKWQRTRISIPKGYSPEERQVIAQEIIDFIIDRSQKKNKDKNNRKFPSHDPQGVLN